MTIRRATHLCDKYFRRHQRRLGRYAGWKWGVSRAADRAGWLRRTISIQPDWLQHPVYIRTNGSSDMDVFDSIFYRGELDFWRSLENNSPEVIVDLGANVGYASVAFLNMFPHAFVLAVEPDPANAAMCRRNLAPYSGRVKIVEGAVWNKRTDLVVSRGTYADGRDHAVEVRPARPGEKTDVSAWDIPSLVSLCPKPRVDILKIDIEGSEQPLFSLNTESWLDLTCNICVEIHGPECERAVAAGLASYDYEKDQTGEYTVFLGLCRKR